MSTRHAAAVVQAEVAPDLQSGLELAAELAQKAVQLGAELIVIPETWLPGYLAWLDVCCDAALWDYPPVKAVFARVDDVGAAYEALLPVASLEARHVGMQRAAEVEGAPLAHQPRCGDLGRGDLIERAELVARAVALRPPRLIECTLSFVVAHRYGGCKNKTSHLGEKANLRSIRRMEAR